MKVTVCFGNVRVVVPCGDGDILVRDLIRESTLRYKKATGKGNDSWVAVHNLRSQSGGGILDPDDRLNDVADDREQIIANFEDGDGVHHGGGDGASGSSVGTGSPDIFHGSDKYAPTYSRTDIEVTGEQIASGLNVPLQVRRGSEPALNQLIGCGPQTNGCGPPDTTRPPIMQDPSKRWSAAPIINDDHSIERNNHNNGYLTPEEEDSIEEDRFLRISRDGSNRLSMQFLDGGGYRWAEAAEKAANSLNSKNKTNGSKSLPRDGSRRKEPLGQANTSSPTQPFEHFDSNTERIETIVIRNEPGQLGVHVVPDYDRMSKERGLLVQGIEPGGRIDRHGKLFVFDRIIEINGQPLQNIPFQRVQEIFKVAQTAPELVLKVIKKRSSSADPFSCKPPAPIYPRSDREDKENVSMVEVEEKFGSNTKLATVSPTKKVPPGSRNPKSLLTANTRRIGRKIELELLKGPHGLGFSITTRDNPAGGNCPIYIKNILPKGAAVEDGRLKPGDRLLEVNGVEMTGKSQAEAVTVLRNAPTGSCVRIVVSRQEDATIPGPNLPRDGGELSTDVSNNKSRAPSPCAPAIPPLPSTHELMNNKHSTERTGSVAKIISQFQEAANKSATSSPLDTKSTEDAVLPWKHREILTFNIPVHDSEKAGLGVSVKGKTTNQNGGQSSDLGIFVKNVLHGGAASRDKRLRTNDQLLNVNGISLLHQSNSDAMETLRRAMLHTEGPVPGSITLTIARRVPSPAPPNNNNNNNINNNHNSSNHVSATSGRDSASSLLTHSSGPETFVGNTSNENESSSYLTDNSGASEKSGNTVIFLPYTKKSESSSANHSLNNSTHSNRSFGNMESWNHPVIDRITGQNTSGTGPHQLRNESYYMATHDHTWNGSFQNDPKLSSPTVNLPSGETILIENEYVPNYPPGTGYTNRNGKTKSNDNLLNNNTTDGKINVSITNCDQSSDSTPTNPTSTDVTYASQLSLENPAGFTRDAFGRQSMSEKRHATLDAKNTGTYQRTKKLREEREKSKDNEKQENGKLIRVGSVESIISLNRSPGHKDEEADKLGQLGPSLGMKKSSSLESLQTMVQGIQMDSDPAYSYRGNQGALRVIRGRGCDDSFRAAVDIDYKSVGKTNDAKKHWLLDPPIAAANSDLDAQDVGFMNARGGPRQSSLNAADNKKAAKKKAGLLKGIGSMFRFGKHRKTLDVIPGLDDRIIMAHENTVHHEKQDSASSQTASSETNQQSSTHNGNESTSSTDQQHQLQQQQQQHQQSPANSLELRPNNPSHQPPPNVPPSHYRQLVHQQMNRMQTQNHTDVNENPIHPAAASSRNQYVQELRSLHQKRHAERQGHYVSEEREDQYERAIRQRLEQVPDTIHGRSASYDVYGDVKRSGSRSAIGAGDPQRFSHYVNYDELQHHLSRRQQHYHSQRQPARDSQQRPMSNFYEYESIQSLMNSQPRSLISSPHSTNHDTHNDIPPAHHITKSSSSSSTSTSTTRITSNAIDKTTSITKQHFTQHARPYQPPPPISRGHEPTYGSRAMNGNPRTYQRYVANHNQRNVHKLSGNRGPFITQVTIEDQTQKTAGSRV
ncbi:partitioning defective 3 homolog isoform X2 [Chrysoperla carnea]|uniref:partitioning defective 3 homolog isoform X2 n=1 Tax=Chrysoperla carnea TaxID=189513 RepID=UPI001D084CF5|nr:partitioning defective 3 homolog isoform X2 [Chrysoperla carnea]